MQFPETDGHLFQVLVWITLTLFGFVVTLVIYIFTKYTNRTDDEIRILRDKCHRFAVDIKELLSHKDEQMRDNARRDKRSDDKKWK